MSRVMTLSYETQIVWGGKGCFCICYDIPVVDTATIFKSIINFVDVFIVSDSSTPELIPNSIPGVVDSKYTCINKCREVGAKNCKCT